MKPDLQSVSSRKPVHRFMLNLNSDLYEWIRETAYREKTSMSSQINTFIREVQEKQQIKKG